MILETRPHPEIFPITALRTPSSLPLRALDVQTRFHSSQPLCTPPSSKVTKKRREAHHEPDSYIRATCSTYCSTDENLGLSSEAHPPRTTLYPPPKEKAAQPRNPTAVKAHMRPCCEARGIDAVEGGAQVRTRGVDTFRQAEDGHRETVGRVRCVLCICSRGARD